MGRESKLFLAPINPEGMRILDIGCGTGIWAIQMGLHLPSPSVGNSLDCSLIKKIQTAVPLKQTRRRVLRTRLDYNKYTRTVVQTAVYLVYTRDFFYFLELS
jgi:cyclopropane fatty-acyl-phospholipid synthase-like methyltransferase